MSQRNRVIMVGGLIPFVIGLGLMTALLVVFFAYQPSDGRYIVLLFSPFVALLCIKKVCVLDNKAGLTVLVFIFLIPVYFYRVPRERIERLVLQRVRSRGGVLPGQTIYNTARIEYRQGVLHRQIVVEIAESEQSNARLVTKFASLGVRCDQDTDRDAGIRDLIS